MQSFLANREFARGGAHGEFQNYAALSFAPPRPEARTVSRIDRFLGPEHRVGHEGPRSHPRL